MHEDNACDPTTVTAHWAEHAAILSGFPQLMQTDRDEALEQLYITGIAFQALAMECGFSRMAEAQAAHDAQHADAAETVDDDAMQLALSIGDPENGRLLFNTLRAETGFACATCHYADRSDTLIGPGLLGIGSPEHDPAAHHGDAEDMDAADDHADDGHVDAADDHADDGHMDAADDHAEDGHMDAADDHADDGHMDAADDHADDDHMDAAEDPIAYLRTSIVDPSAFVVPGFPDKLMPAVYGEILTEEEINDLIAYLLTLR